MDEPSLSDQRESKREFEAFYSRNQHRVIAFLRPLIPRDDPSTAEDLAQDAFAVAWKHWMLLRMLLEPQRLRWMHTALSRLAIGEGKRQRRWHQRLPLVYEPDLSCCPDPQDAALAAITAAECERALATMSQLERSVSVLCWVLGYSAAEAARVLDEKEATVRSVKKRARDKLLAQVGADAIKYWSQEDETSRGGTV